MVNRLVDKSPFILIELAKCLSVKGFSTKRRGTWENVLKVLSSLMTHNLERCCLGGAQSGKAPHPFYNNVEINLFDAVAVSILLFSDISLVKHNIGLTLFGYFTSA